MEEADKTPIPPLCQPYQRLGVALRRTLHHQQEQGRRRPLRRLRKETDLTANLVQKGIRRAIEAVQSGVEKLKKGENTSQPAFDSWSVVYDKRSATFNDGHATLSTPNAESPPNTSSHPKTSERTRRSVGTTRARRGIEPEMPDERGTSSSCSVCGHEDKDSRGERGLWKCDRCGVVVHGDVNGADNIRQETRTVTPPLGSEDSGNGCLAQPRVIQFDRTRGFQPRDSRTGATKP